MGTAAQTQYEEILDDYLIGLMDCLEALEGKPG
jgi:hypothetical protein